MMKWSQQIDVAAVALETAMTQAAERIGKRGEKVTPEAIMADSQVITCSETLDKVAARIRSEMQQWRFRKRWEGGGE